MKNQSPLSTESYKGTRDFYPRDMQLRRWMLGHLFKTVQGYGYRQYDGPMLESFDLYAAKTGEEIVEKQLYWFMDRGDRKVAMRPEMTPTLARMVAAQLNELPRPMRLFSVPNLWRYERPQRGRLREHWQLNVDVLGGDPVYADAEVLELAMQLIASFEESREEQIESKQSVQPGVQSGRQSFIRVRVNHRKIMDHFFSQVLKLDAAQALKVVKAIDAKDKVESEKFKSWLTEAGVQSHQFETLMEFFKSSLDELKEKMPCEGVEHLQKVFDQLKPYSNQVVFDPTIMRGMDYYTGTVFEIYDNSPENHRAMFGGGRYDNLVGLFSKHPEKDALSGVGFGMGDVSLQNFLETHQLIPQLGSEIDVFISLPHEKYFEPARKLAGVLRQKGLRVILPLQVSGFGAQLKLAAKHSASVAVLFGDDEWARHEVLIKDLERGEQKTILWASADQELMKYFKKN